MTQARRPRPPAASPSKMKISSLLVSRMSESPALNMQFAPPALMPGVIPSKGPLAKLAKDYALSDTFNYLNVNGANTYFRGYPYLAQLAQIFEYRVLAEIPAKEMTRRFVKLVSSGDAPNGERIAKLEELLKKYNVRDVIRNAIVDDALFGRGQIYIDLKGPRNSDVSDDPEELNKPLNVSPAKIPRGALNGFKTVNPYWTSPLHYNSDRPLSRSFYRPQAWLVMGQEVHASRLLEFISRPVPDLMKPTYNFSGLSMSQLAEPYVENWLRTRNSVSDTIHSFSTSGILTDLGAELTGGSDGSMMNMRAQLFNQTRDNKGVMLLNKATEEFFQFNMPLGGLDSLQSQALEQLCCVGRIPSVILLGVSPSGLNVSTDGEVRGFYNRMHAEQEDLITQPLAKMLDIIQLSEFGDIDPTISFEFLPLYQPTDIELAQIRKTDMDAAIGAVGAGVLAAEEVRTKLAADPASGYNSIDVSQVPELPEPADDPFETDDNEQRDEG